MRLGLGVVVILIFSHIGCGRQWGKDSRLHSTPVEVLPQSGAFPVVQKLKTSLNKTYKPPPEIVSPSAADRTWRDRRSESQPEDVFPTTRTGRVLTMLRLAHESAAKKKPSRPPISLGLNVHDYVI